MSTGQRRPATASEVTARGLTRFTLPAAPSRRRFPVQPQQDQASNGGEHELPAPLRRVMSEREQVEGETCEMCGVRVGDRHRHVVDLEQRGMLCTCRGCALLFTERGAGSYRTVPEDLRRVDPFHLDRAAWGALGIPVGIAFVVHNTQLDETVAFYPSPGGATESELPMGSWDDIVADNPSLVEVEPDVEAVLVRTDRPGPGRPDAVPDQPECFVVPVDACYELVGTLRLHWRGFDGGQEVRDAVAEFFADLHERTGGRPRGGGS